MTTAVLVAPRLPLPPQPPLATGRFSSSRRLVSLLLLCVVAALTLVPSSARDAPRVASTVPVYRPLYPPYHTYAAYKAALIALIEDPRHEDMLRATVSKERTFGGENLYLMQLGHWHKRSAEAEFIPPGTPRTPARRPKLLLSFGEHARELITVESFFHLIEYILDGSKDARADCNIVGSSHAFHGGAVSPTDSIRMTTSAGYRARWSRFLLDHVDVHLLGVSNPDGKVHIETATAKPASTAAGAFCWRNTGRGVDLNRNAAWEFDGPGSSSQPGNEEYHGPHAFSEAETRFIRDLHITHKYAAYVSVHSGEQQLFVPFVDTESKRLKRGRPTTPLELQICRKVVNSPRMNRWLHDSGIGYEMNDYSADGTLMDYMAGVADVPLVFCVELWGGPTHEDCFVQFNPDPRETVMPVPEAPGKFEQQSALARDLRQMHVFYIELFNSIIAEHYGITYRDPLETADPQLRADQLRQLQSVCEVENSLYEEQANARQAAGARAPPRVQAQQ